MASKIDPDTVSSFEPEEVIERMKKAGAEAFHRGAPCVPGLDPLWEAELQAPRNVFSRGSHVAIQTGQAWRRSWLTQAARDYRLGKERCTTVFHSPNTPRTPTRPCIGELGHEGACRHD